MKLVPKLTAALVVGTFCVLAANGFLRVRRETALLQADRVHNHALVGRALGAAVSAVWHSDGRADAMRVVEGANEHEGVVRVGWVDAASVASDAHVDAAELEALPTGKTVTHVATTPAGDSRFSYTAVALGQERVGFIELSEPLEAEHRTSRTIILDTLLTTLALILMSGLLAAALGHWLVGRPVQALSAKARRIGRGDFSNPLALPQEDELGLLATEMNAMCDRLEEATERVEQETAARIATLDQLRHADRLKTVGMLASGIAHELGTPLNVVSARAQMIASGESSTEEAVDYARVIAGAAERMTKIIRQLLAFARRQPSQHAPRDLQRLAADTCELLRPLAAKNQVRIELRKGADAVANVDGDGIQQALTNLVVNAIHAMPNGGVVEVSTALEDRAAGDEHPGQFVILRVRDEGTGIAKQHLDHVFEPFFTTKSVGDGTGLGLSVTHGIVEDHGGFIDVQSEPAKGTVFTVHLPSKEPA